MKLQKKIGALFMVAAMTFGTGLTVSAKDVSDYHDVHENDWHYSYVKDVSERGLMTGLDDTTFGPSQKLARGQFATIIYRMYGSPQTSYKALFNDVTDGNFYSVPVTWASQFGVITGYTDGSGNFGSADDITREQLATMLYRYADKLGYDLSVSETANNFPDKSSVSAFAIDGMNWCISKGIITGDQGKINPQGTVNRAVCATMISRFIGDSGHVHEWVHVDAKTHQEDWGYDETYLISEAVPSKWVSTGKIAHYVCTNCGYDTTDVNDLSRHKYENFDNGCGANTTYVEETGYWTDPVPAQYGTRHVENWVTVTDEPAYDYCSGCGARRE